MCLSYVLIPLGQSARALNIFLHPTPRSMLFWDGNVLSGYLVPNIIIGWKVLEAEHTGSAPPKWVKPLILYLHPHGLFHPYHDRIHLLRPVTRSVILRHPRNLF